MKRVTAILQNQKWQEHMALLAEYEKDRIYCCHDLDHLLSVARMAWILYLENHRDAAFADLAQEESKKEMIYAAALLHDIGRAKEYADGTDHHEASVVIAKEILAECGFEDREAEIVLDAVYCHRGHGDAFREVSVLIQRADHLSRLCFTCEASDTCKWSEEKKNRDVVC